MGVPEKLTEALKNWRAGVYWLDDPEGDSGVNLEDVCANAHCVVATAEAESVPLEEFIPDPAERQRLQNDAEEYKRCLEAEDEWWDEYPSDDY